MAKTGSKSGPKGGRPAFEPTDDQRGNVEAMAGFGIQQDAIAALIKNPETGNPVTHKTLRQHFRHELDTGKTRMISTVAKRLYDIATKGKGREAVTACIFIMKAQGGWSEKSRLEHSTPDGEPFPIKVYLPDNGRGPSPTGPAGKVSRDNG